MLNKIKDKINYISDINELKNLDKSKFPYQLREFLKYNLDYCNLSNQSNTTINMMYKNKSMLNLDYINYYKNFISSNYINENKEKIEDIYNTSNLIFNYLKDIHNDLDIKMINCEVVGGCIRDILTDKDVTDIDIYLDVENFMVSMNNYFFSKDKLTNILDKSPILTDNAKNDILNKRDELYPKINENLKVLSLFSMYVLEKYFECFNLNPKSTESFDIASLKEETLGSSYDTSVLENVIKIKKENISFNKYNVDILCSRTNNIDFVENFDFDLNKISIPLYSNQRNITYNDYESFFQNIYVSEYFLSDYINNIISLDLEKVNDKNKERIINKRLPKMFNKYKDISFNFDYNRENCFDFYNHLNIKLEDLIIKDKFKDQGNNLNIKKINHKL